ncbi:non-canonical purine NTP diphosphatase [Parabacteroides sp. OttesenSCG-928-N08]|nr:non-canonical purine NTP diphosphatase [Parabacteroides sp. OttesenSCG-928-N08]
MKLVFATNNQHKLEEVASMLPSSIALVSLKEIGCFDDIPETADTLEGNALQKARYIKEKYGYDCFADDTGLEVEALNRAPGVYSARYAGPEHNAEANMQKLLEDMKGCENRNARFRTVVALLLNDQTYLFEGIIKGEIIEERRGGAGFGYDPIFVPEQFNETFAELGNEIKNKISHRALAINKLADFFANLPIE